MAKGQKTRVAVNGYGVIGKPVAAAVMQEDDMALAGVSDVMTDWRALALSCRRCPQAAELRPHRLQNVSCSPQSGDKHTLSKDHHCANGDEHK